MGFKEIIKRIVFRLNGRVLRLKPRGSVKGNVLFSYITLPFFRSANDPLTGHTNYWEARDMSRAWLEAGYAVDVIDLNNKHFLPKRQYDFFIDNRFNLERLAPLMPSTVKIFHATNASAEELNSAEAKRITDVKARRGASLQPRRTLEPYTIEAANMMTTVCGPYANATYPLKKTYLIPLSSTHTFDKPFKDFDQVKNTYIWFGGAGAVHKGLDLVLEAFAQMPAFKLIVCGKFAGEDDFVAAYRKELYETPNIRSIGYIDPGGEVFDRIRKEAVGIVYPSSSEGCASSVEVAMHAGLIPIISYETGVGFGTILKENTVAEIMQEVKALAELPAEALRDRSLAAWEYARTHHTREHFAKSYRAFVQDITK